MPNFNNALFVAQKTWGLESKITKTKTLQGGMANQGIFKHTLSSGKVFIEKRTTRLNEVLFAQSFIKKQKEGGVGIAVPEIFDIVEDGSVYYIFMEHFDIMEKDFLSQKSSAVLIAQLAYSLHQDLSTIRTPTINKKLDESLYLEKLIETFPQKHLKEKKMLSKINKIFKKQNKILCHNDLFVSNIGFRNQSPENLVAIDFGLMGINLPGSEFHHFLGRSSPDFFTNLIKEYSEISKIDPTLLTSEAILYAGFREFDRSKKNKGVPERFQILKDSIVLANETLMV